METYKGRSMSNKWVFFGIVEAVSIYGYFCGGFSGAALAGVIFAYFAVTEWSKNTHAKRLETSNEALVAKVEQLEKSSEARMRRMEELVAKTQVQGRFQ